MATDETQGQNVGRAWHASRIELRVRENRLIAGQRCVSVHQGGRNKTGLSRRAASLLVVITAALA